MAETTIWSGASVGSRAARGAPTAGRPCRSLGHACGRHLITLAPALLPMLFALASPALAQDFGVDIKGTPIEELMQISVTTVSRWEEELQTSAAAAYVLTREDIRRARVTSVPEALRLVPGVQVAKIDANKWAVSIRGFNSRLANKLLVLVDGRSVYDPLFAGVFWEGRDVVLEEIERIEVIRGPGSTLWGSNAVNGVINIITRHARDTQGARATVGAGTEERGRAGGRYGWQPSANSHARLYGDWVERDGGFSPADGNDDARRVTGGGRLDWDASATDRIMLKGDAFDGTFGPEQSFMSFADLEQEGYSLVARWEHDRHDGSQMMLQFWHDHFVFDDEIFFGETRNSYDLEFQHAFPAGDAHRLVWGAGYRTTSDDTRSGPFIAVVPASRRDELSSLFLQDEISLAARKIRLTLGTKIEHNSYSGLEWQPNGRLAWVPDPDHTFWTAVSRAVRSPSRLDSDLVVLTTPFTGNPNFEAENLIAYEAGYRAKVAAEVWMDIAAFHNVYRQLQSIEVQNTFANKLRGTTSGVELAGRWQASSAWSYEIAYSFLNMDMAAEADSLDTTSAALLEGGNPRHQVVLRTGWTPSALFEVDVTLRYVDRLRALNVPSYLVADIGVSWHPRSGLELTLAAQNLLDRSHPEQPGVMATEVQRGFYLKANWEL